MYYGPMMTRIRYTATRIALLVTALAIMLGLGACSATLPEQTEATAADASAVREKLTTTQTIKLDKKVMSLGDEWSVKADGESVGKVEGMDLKAFGDVYSFVSPKGGLIAGEEEKIFNVAKTAKFFNGDQKETGVLTKKILSLLAEYKLEDTKGKTVATLSQKFGLTFKAEIKDADGKVAWKGTRKMLSVGPSITLERVTKDAAVTPTDAILMVLVASEVYDGESK